MRFPLIRALYLKRFLQRYFVLYVRNVWQIVTEVKELKTVLTFLYFVSYKSNASNLWQLVCKLISVRLILFYDFVKMEGPKTKFMQ